MTSRRTPAIALVVGKSLGAIDRSDVLPGRRVTAASAVKAGIGYVTLFAVPKPGILTAARAGGP